MEILNKPYFWSYETKNIPSNLKIEHVLKFGDINEINTVIKKYGFELCYKIWSNKIVPDSRFDRLNYFLARFIFKISDKRKEILLFLKNHKRTRFENKN